ncbi:cytochrome P450 [Gonapodya prolifera JEL478]|uniref:Cytochrome P450 n=1 Tax=Gonapodya prolifera (strain JEL478) TaxID=1344416 RepID=A0A139A9V6_GONPJ|nr:cytochrome P450 [Gonapodya prolifera JEL478]|eukprot:KXS13566.1 cytochrome P450 [Gonapodya prolifera JEL478]
MSLGLVVAAAAFLYLFYELYRRTFLDRWDDDVPISLNIPFINSPRIDKIRVQHQVVLEKSREVGAHISRGILPWKPWRSTVVVGHPTILREIFVGKDWEAFDRPIWSQEPSQTYHAGGLILIPNGKEWREARELLGKTFTTTTVRSYMPILTEELKTFVDLAEKENALHPDGFDIQEFYNRYTFDTITRLTFGSDLGVQHDKETQYLKAWDSLLAVSSLWNLIVSVSGEWAVPKSITNEFFKNYNVIKDLITSNLERVRSGKTVDAKVSILDDMMRGQLPEFMQTNEEALVKQLMTLLFAGHDTTSALLSFLTHHISNNLEWQNLVRQEVTKAFPGNEPLALEKLESLPHLTAVVKETLRMYPSAPFGAGRQMNRDLRLSYADKDGKQKFVQFRKGDVVMSAMFVSQMTPEFWNKPVDDWDPSRWLDDPNGGASSPYAYAPFGNGARRCLGERLALGEARITLAELVRRFEVVPAKDPEGKFKFAHYFTGTIKAANGVGVRLLPLSKA